jgi:MFS transporter, DHA1 family, tetracycline resistance protein
MGIAIGSIGYFGYGVATRGWMMFPWLVTWFFGAIVMPTTNALMSNRIPPDAQGELQGAVASLFSLSSIIGPLLMTQLFGYFSRPDAPIQIPGAAFFTAGMCALTCLVLYWRATREPRPLSVPASVIAG